MRVSFADDQGQGVEELRKDNHPRRKSRRHSVSVVFDGQAPAEVPERWPEYLEVEVHGNEWTIDDRRLIDSEVESEGTRSQASSVTNEILPTVAPLVAELDGVVAVHRSRDSEKFRAKTFGVSRDHLLDEIMEASERRHERRTMIHEFGGPMNKRFRAKTSVSSNNEDGVDVDSVIGGDAALMIDKLVLAEDSSDDERGESFRTPNRSQRFSDSEDDLYRMAANYVNDAINGRMPRPMKMHFDKGYRFYFNKWTRRFLFCVIILHMNLVWDEPVSSRIANEPGHWTNFAELACVLFYLLDLSFKVYLDISGSEKRMGKIILVKKWTVLYAILVIMISADCFTSLANTASVKFARPLRPVLLLSQMRRLRHFSGVFIRTLYQVLDSLLLVFFFLLIYAIVGIRVFAGTYVDDNGKALVNGHFETIDGALLSLFVLLSTENYPNIMNPALDKGGYSSIYFISFLLLGVYLLLSLMVAVTCDAYKTQHKNQVIHDRIKERRALMAAFHLLDQNKNHSIDYMQWEKLIQNILKNPDPTLVEVLFNTIDDDTKGAIDLLDFFALCDVLLLRFEKRSQPTQLRIRLTNFLARWFPVPRVRRWVDHQYFARGVNVLIIANTAVLSMQSNAYRDNTQLLDTATILEDVCLSLFCVELLLKIVGYGWNQFWRSPWNKFDFFVIMLSVWMPLFFRNTRYVFAFPVLRAFTALRVLSGVGKFKVLLQTLFKTAPIMGVAGVILALLTYSYATLGMEIMQGRAQFDDPRANFDTFWGACLALLQLISTNNWNDILYNAMNSDSVASTISIFFITYYLIAVIMLVNVLVALILDVFTIAQRAEAKTKMEMLHMDPESNDSGRNETEDTRGKAYLKVYKKRRWSRELVAQEVFNTQNQEKELQELDKYAEVDLGALRRVKSEKKMKEVAIGSQDQSESSEQDGEGSPKKPRQKRQSLRTLIESHMPEPRRESKDENPSITDSDL